MASSPRLALAKITALSVRERILIAAAKGGGMPEDAAPDKVAALLAAARALDAIGARFALIGGVAVGIHSGVPRATVDTDLAIASVVDRSTVIEAFSRAGFRLVGEFPHSVNFRHPSGEPVQLAFDPAFDAMLERSERIDLSGCTVPIVSKSDLVAMKRRAAADPGRRRSKALRDQADVALLEGDVPDPDEGW